MYTGPAKIFKSRKDPEKQVAVVEVEEHQIFFSLHLQQPVGVCGRHRFTTNLAGTSVIIMQKFDAPLMISHLSTKDVSLYDNLVSFIGYSNFMRGMHYHDVFAQFTVQECEQEQKVLQNNINIMKNHPSDVVLEVDGKKGFISQRRGAVLHIIKCTSSDVSYRHIEEDSEEIPVFHKKNTNVCGSNKFCFKAKCNKVKKWNLPSNQVENWKHLVL